jgi:1,2-dihydroxy-3-keto-5-methylthiopentene dioxygenase
MATLNIPQTHQTITDASEIKAYLAGIGIGYHQWRPSQPLADSATPEEILQAYSADLDVLKAEGGYVTADVIDIKPDTPNLDAMLNKFNKEHWHDEDEVRFTLEGHGLFYINPNAAGSEAEKPAVGIEVEPGDLLIVPKGTLHWFELCGDRRIRAIRLFQDMAGWTPHYTDSGKETGFSPLCFGPQFVAA